ncbi:glycine--tRNA ligase, chloroplastic/mitochondrial 2-like [Hibiscus syriacus]|uniref:glycine--tRNA ligase, chloroplastic/mitochondrial 2-like n=1 Tax=Hibiscus syriacus TaxID=106335 RepID=UPI001923EFAF|nr:glycine--tRNA ligase, chloroplastic/mitochondrial 2-like [Hibiscus syriacus]
MAGNAFALPFMSNVNNYSIESCTFRKEICAYYLEHASVSHIQKHFYFFEEEARSLLALGLSIPAYDQLLKTSHFFNILDSRGCVGVTERARYFGRMHRLISVENLCPQQAENELKVRAAEGFFRRYVVPLDSKFIKANGESV